MAFQRTVDILLRLIAQSQNADVAHLSTGDNRETVCARWLSIPLHASWHLFLGWREPSATPDLSSSAPLIESLNRLLSLNAEESRVHKLLAEAATLQWKLADSKLADRAAGLVATEIQQQVSKTLDSIDHVDSITRRISDLRLELESRKHIATAKAILQSRHGLTEQLAYAHLHQTSRRTRRPIAEVAKEICAGGRSRTRRIA